MKYLVIPLFAIGCLAAADEVALAVHLDVWVHVDAANRLDSGYFDVNAGVPITTQDRAVGYNFQEFDQSPYYANNPGYFAEQNLNADGTINPAGSGLPGGSIFGFNVLSDLLYWNGADPVSFSPVPAGETLLTNLGSNNVTVGTGTGAQPGFPLEVVRSGAADGSLHIHVNSTINAGPNSSAPGNGIYIFQEQLTTNAPGVTTSLPFWIVFNNGLTEDQRGEAINFLYPNQWCGPFGGSYNTDGNWSGTIPLPGQIVPVPQSPNGVDAVANFFDNLYSDSAITLDGPVTVGTLNFKSAAHYTLAGPSSLTLQSSGTAQINLSLGNHTIAAPLIIASNTIVTAGTGSLDLQGAQTWGDNTSITVQCGTLNYTISSGATTVGANAALTIAPGATVNMGGTVNPLSDGTHTVILVNGGHLNVKASGMLIDRVTGTGTTSIAAGASLTANSIIQDAIVIGGTSSIPAILTIDASDSLGNPLAVTAGSLVEPLVLHAQESAALELPLVNPLTDADRAGDSSSAASSLDGGFAALAGHGSQQVPEPSTWGIAIAGIVFYSLFHRSRAAQTEQQRRSEAK